MKIRINEGWSKKDKRSWSSYKKTDPRTGQPVLHPDTDENGEPHPKAGEQVYLKPEEYWSPFSKDATDGSGMGLYGPVTTRSTPQIPRGYVRFPCRVDAKGTLQKAEKDSKWMKANNITYWLVLDIYQPGITPNGDEYTWVEEIVFNDRWRWVDFHVDDHGEWVDISFRTLGILNKKRKNPLTNKFGDILDRQGKVICTKQEQSELSRASLPAWNKKSMKEKIYDSVEDYENDPEAGQAPDAEINTDPEDGIQDKEASAGEESYTDDELIDMADGETMDSLTQDIPDFDGDEEEIELEEGDEDCDMCGEIHTGAVCAINPVQSPMRLNIRESKKKTINVGDRQQPEALAQGGDTSKVSISIQNLVSDSVDGHPTKIKEGKKKAWHKSQAEKEKRKGMRATILRKGGNKFVPAKGMKNVKKTPKSKSPPPGVGVLEESEVSPEEAYEKAKEKVRTFINAKWIWPVPGDTNNPVYKQWDRLEKSFNLPNWNDENETKTEIEISKTWKLVDAAEIPDQIKTKEAQDELDMVLLTLFNK